MLDELWLIAQGTGHARENVLDELALEFIRPKSIIEYVLPAPFPPPIISGSSNHPCSRAWRSGRLDDVSADDFVHSHALTPIRMDSFAGAW